MMQGKKLCISTIENSRHGLVFRLYLTFFGLCPAMQHYTRGIIRQVVRYLDAFTLFFFFFFVAQQIQII